MQQQQYARYSPPRHTLLLVGTIAALLALACLQALFFYWEITQPGLAGQYWLLYFSVPLAAALTSSCFWWYGILLPASLTIKRGIAMGIASSIVAHPIAWFLAFLLSLISGIGDGLGQWVHPLSEKFLWLIPNALFLSLFSLLIIGWLTTLIGGLAGGLLAFLQMKAEEHQWCIN